MAAPLIIRPDHNLARSATVASMTNEDSAYPGTNLVNLNPQLEAKATAGATTIVWTWASAVVPVILAIVKHNLPGASAVWTSNAGLNQAATIPANRGDGHPTSIVTDLRSSPPTALTQLTLTITGAAADVVLGEFVAASQATALPLVYGGWEVGEDQPVRTHRLGKGYRHRRGKGYLERRLSGEVVRRTDRAALTEVWRAAQGPLTPFLVIAEGDAWLGQFSEDPHAWRPDAPAIERSNVVIEELSMGLVP